MVFAVLSSQVQRQQIVRSSVWSIVPMAKDRRRRMWKPVVRLAWPTSGSADWSK